MEGGAAGPAYGCVLAFQAEGAGGARAAGGGGVESNGCSGGDGGVAGGGARTIKRVSPRVSPMVVSPVVVSPMVVGEWEAMAVEVLSQTHLSLTPCDTFQWLHGITKSVIVVFVCDSTKNLFVVKENNH